MLTKYCYNNKVVVKDGLGIVVAEEFIRDEIEVGEIQKIGSILVDIESLVGVSTREVNVGKSLSSASSHFGGVALSVGVSSFSASTSAPVSSASMSNNSLQKTINNYGIKQPETPTIDSPGKTLCSPKSAPTRGKLELVSPFKSPLINKRRVMKHIPLPRTSKPRVMKLHGPRRPIELPGGVLDQLNERETKTEIKPDIKVENEPSLNVYASDGN